MRAYTITSGLLFAALVLAHALRLAAEGFAVAGNPIFLGTTLVAAGMAGWAAWVLRRGTDSR